MADIADLQRETEAFFKTPVSTTRALGAPAPPRFSEFIPDQLDRALALAGRFMALADQAGGEAGLTAVLDAARQASTSEDPDLVKYALMVFITHHPEGSRLPIPPLEERSPDKVPAATRGLEAAPAAAAAGEAQLDWYRADPLANAHHEHWHIVYPSGGIPDAGGHTKLKDRQGELFFYMHEQMLARYDTERLAAGLDRVKPISNYSETFADGYDSGLSGFSPRRPGLHMVDVNRADLGINYTVAGHAQLRDRLLAAVAAGFFRPTPPATGNGARVTPDLLGAAEEATIGTPSRATYGNHHGMGHVLLALMGDPHGTSPPGIMWDTATAIRDPLFYRWHKHVDDMCFTWQEHQPANDFSDAPPVRLRKGLGTATPANASPDIILAFQDAIPGAGTATFDGAAYGEATFGGAHWDTDFAAVGATTGELQTHMLTRPINGTPLPYLDQREFFYFLRVENRAATVTEVTVRIFLVAQSVAADRRMWIELDKFHHTLQASQKAVIFRRAADSSIIRKPGVKPPQPLQKSGAAPSDNYCECGWPYNLLLPRGTHAGMGFRLLVLLTDWNKDRVPDDSGCGSMSFCGAKDRYPDTRAMGYPFDRPFAAAHPLAGIIAAHDNMATRDITIRWV